MAFSIEFKEENEEISRKKETIQGAVEKEREEYIILEKLHNGRS